MLQIIFKKLVKHSFAAKVFTVFLLNEIEEKMNIFIKKKDIFMCMQSHFSSK